MEKFEHGGNIYRAALQLKISEDKIIDFSANINPLGLSVNLRNALINGIDNIKHYPDPQYTSLIKSIAVWEGVEENKIIVGNGATEIIYEFIRVLEPKRALILAPTFVEYERALRRIRCQVEYFYLKEENSFRIDDSFPELLSGYDLVIICNPNNPTSQLAEAPMMLKTLNVCKEQGINLIVDEAFIDFVDDQKKSTMVPYINSYDNLYIIKALTKFFAIPGLRIGYGITSNKNILNRMITEKQPWSINSMAALAGEVVMKDSNYIKESIEFMRIERDYLYREIKSIDLIKVFEPKANYILFKILVAGKNIETHLLNNRLLIRNCSNYRNLSEAYYRVAVKHRENNDNLIEKLKEVLDES